MVEGYRDYECQRCPVQKIPNQDKDKCVYPQCNHSQYINYDGQCETCVAYEKPLYKESNLFGISPEAFECYKPQCE